MEKLRLLIAEGNDAVRTALADMLRGSYQVRCCAEGNAARELLRTFRPDMLVLDLMLPGYDGISLLQWAAGEDLRPVVLATSKYANDYIVDAVARLGVAYLMLKPCDLGAMAARLGDLSQRICPIRVSGPDLRTQVSSLLLSLGVPTKLRGYAYLREAVLLMAADPTQSITKVLYPEVAKRCACASTHVERSIRSAIGAAWSRRDDNLWRLYFYPDEVGGIPRPTNGEFISRLADSIRGQQDPQEAPYVQNYSATG